MVLDLATEEPVREPVTAHDNDRGLDLLARMVRDC